MKKKIILVSFIFLLTGCLFYDEYKMPKDAYIDLNDYKFEVYSEKTIKDLIKETNTEILNEEDILDTEDTGEKEIEIVYKYNKKKYKYIVNYEVLDTTPPTVLRASKYRSIYEGYDLDFCENTTFIDNYDREPTCTFEGYYDNNTPGTYYLSYIFKDSFDNTKTIDFELDVLSSDFEESDYEEYYEEESIDFNDIVERYKTDDTMIGIDVSSWQGDIDFDKVKKAGCEFVIIRVAVTVGEDQKIEIDNRYKEYIKGAKKAGLKVGAYLYTEAKTLEEVKEQAKFVKKTLNKEKLDLPVAYDFENWSEIMDYKINKHDLLTFVDEFDKVLDKYEVMIYGSYFYLENVWDNNKYKTWLAHYTDETDYDKDYMIWQMTNVGIIDGISGYVDVDILKK